MEAERRSGGGEGESDARRQSGGGGGGRDVRVSINPAREGLRGGPRLGQRLICVFQRVSSRKGHHRRFASRCWPQWHSDREQSQAG